MLLWTSSGAVALLLVALWYCYFVRQNRRRSLEALLWVETALGGHGRVVGVHWVAPSRLHAQLRLAPGIFQNASVALHMAPREVPLAWLLARIRRRAELVVFEADLDMPPD